MNQYSGVVPVDAKKVMDVPSAISELQNAVERLDGDINIFQSRLSPITRCEPSPDEGLKAVRQSSCQVSEQIRNQVEKILAIAHRVRCHTESIEL